MRTQNLLSRAVVGAFLMCGIGLLSNSAAQAGPLSPPAGSVASTSKTLQSVEPRIDLQNAPASANVTTNVSYDYIINSPGSYYLSANIATAKLNAIKIQSSDVTLDLNGFEISRASGTGGTGVQGFPGTENIAVINGSVRGFALGVDLQGGVPLTRGTLVRNVRASLCTSVGIALGETATADSCSAYSCGFGIFVNGSSVVNNCTAESCTGTSGISAGFGSVVTNCTALSCSSINGISIDNSCSMTNCAATKCSGTRAILTQVGCSLTNCSASQNTSIWGIQTGAGCSLINCNANQNSSTSSSSGGINAGSNSALVGCSANGNTSTAASFTTTTGIGILAAGGSTLESCTASSNKGDGFEASFGTLTGCVANSNSGNGFNSAQRTNYFNCLANANTLAGIRANLVGIIRSCTAAQNAQHGIVIDTGGGYDLIGNVSEENGNNATAQGDGIRILGSFCRLEDNHCYVNWRNYEVVGVVGVVMVRNFAGAPGSGSNFVIAAGNKIGTIVSAPASAAINGNTGGAGMGSTDPTANYSY